MYIATSFCNSELRINMFNRGCLKLLMPRNKEVVVGQGRPMNKRDKFR